MPENKTGAVKAGAQSKITTGIGLAAGLPILVAQMLLLLDKDAATNPDWRVVIATIAGMAVAFFAGDANKVSDEPAS